MALVLLHDSCVPTGCTRGDEAAKLEFGVRRSSGEDLTLCWFLRSTQSTPSPHRCFFYCILIYVTEIPPEGQEQFKLYCADMNQNYSKQQIWPQRTVVKKPAWTIQERWVEVRGTEGKGKQVTLNDKCKLVSGVK